MTSGKRILRAWLVIAFVASVGWAAGLVYADRYVDSVDREAICRNTGVALGDTVLRSVDRARRDSTELADRNCARRYDLARQGRENRVHIPVAIGVLLGGLVTGLVSLWWGFRKVFSR